MKVQVRIGPPIRHEALYLELGPEGVPSQPSGGGGIQAVVLKPIDPSGPPPAEPEIENPLPTLDLRGLVRARDVEEFLFAFTSGFFHIPVDELSGETDLFWLEKRFLSLADGVPIEDVRYERIFINPDGSGGIPDQGLCVWFFGQVVTDAMGLHITHSGPEETTLQAYLEYMLYFIEGIGYLEPD